MKRICIALILFLFACKREDIPIGEIIYDLRFSRDDIIADGGSQMAVSVKLDSTADADKRKVVFTASAGSFTGAAADGTFTKEAEFVGKSLIASALWKTGASPTTVEFTARPAAISPYSDFIVKRFLVVDTSKVTKIIASSSAFGVLTNYLGEVTITGALKNALNRNASSGYKVDFEDFLLSGIPAAGRYRDERASSNESSTVSTIYSPGPIAPGTTIKVRVTLLDDAGNHTNVKDSIFITVTI